jgi:hypothetical protein
VTPAQALTAMQDDAHNFAASEAKRREEKQEQLERKGWRLDVSWLPKSQQWDVWAWHMDRSDSQHFTRADRTDALSHALHWADSCEDARSRCG